MPRAFHFPDAPKECLRPKSVCAQRVCAPTGGLTVLDLPSHSQGLLTPAWRTQVAYQIRFESSRTERTKILFLTEGLLLRQASPALPPLHRR
jgi:hypothetical protein